jgi:hypothetical protein
MYFPNISCIAYLCLCLTSCVSFICIKICSFSKFVPTWWDDRVLKSNWKPSSEYLFTSSYYPNCQIHLIGDKTSISMQSVSTRFGPPPRAIIKQYQLITNRHYEDKCCIYIQLLLVINWWPLIMAREGSYYGGVWMNTARGYFPIHCLCWFHYYDCVNEYTLICSTVRFVNLQLQTVSFSCGVWGSID